MWRPPTKRQTSHGSEDIFWILWYSNGLMLRNKRDNPDDKFEVHQGLYGVGGWCKFKIANPDPSFMISLMNLPDTVTGAPTDFTFSLYRSPAKIPDELYIGDVFKDEVPIQHFYFLSECHLDEGPFRSDIGFLLTLQEKSTQASSFKAFTFFSPKDRDTFFGEYLLYLSATVGVTIDISAFRDEQFQWIGPRMPQFFENRYFLEAMNYWCDYFQYEYALEFNELKVHKEIKLSTDNIGLGQSLSWGGIEIQEDDILNTTIMCYNAFETEFLSGTIDRPVQWLGQPIRFGGKDYRVIYYKYRYTPNSYFTCSFVATLGYGTSTELNPIPRSIYKKVIPDEAASLIKIGSSSPFFLGQIKEDAGTVVDDDESEDSNEKINVYYETAGMNVRNPEKYMPSNIVIPAYKASPFAAPGAGVQYPEPMNAVGIFGGDSPHLSVCLGQIFQKGFKPVRNSKYDYRLTMLDGSSFYFDDVNQIWKLIGNKLVEIGATENGDLDYKTIPETPETCSIQFDGANKKITLKTDTLSILIDKGNSKIELSDGTRKLTLDSDKAELVNGTKKVTLGSSTTEMTDGTRKITMNGSTVDVT